MRVYGLRKAVAQLVEQRTENSCADGPIPPLATSFFDLLRFFFPNIKDFSIYADLCTWIGEIRVFYRRISCS